MPVAVLRTVSLVFLGRVTVLTLSHRIYFDFPVRSGRILEKLNRVLRVDKLIRTECSLHIGCRRAAPLTPCKPDGQSPEEERISLKGKDVGHVEYNVHARRLMNHNNMKKFTSLLIGVSLALAGAAYAQQTEESPAAGGKKGKEKTTEQAQPKTPKTQGATGEQAAGVEKGHKGKGANVTGATTNEQGATGA